MIKVYRVVQGSKVIANFTKVEEAHIMASKLEGVDVEPGIELYDSYKDFAENGPEARRKRAYDKLTEDERKLLGVKP